MRRNEGWGKLNCKGERSNTRMHFLSWPFLHATGYFLPWNHLRNLMKSISWPFSLVNEGSCIYLLIPISQWSSVAQKGINYSVFQDVPWAVPNRPLTVKKTQPRKHKNCHEIEEGHCQIAHMWSQLKFAWNWSPWLWLEWEVRLRGFAMIYRKHPIQTHTMFINRKTQYCKYVNSFHTQFQSKSETFFMDFASPF